MDLWQKDSISDHDKYVHSNNRSQLTNHTSQQFCLFINLSFCHSLYFSFCLLVISSFWLSVFLAFCRSVSTSSCRQWYWQYATCTILVNYCDNNDKVCSSPPGCRPTAAMPESLEPVRNTRSGKYVEGYSNEISGADDFSWFWWGSNIAQIKRRETVAQKLIVIMAE